jgi:ABC-type transporter Mla subunit MlaD
MSEKPSAFRIGLFVLAGVAILLGGLFLFGIRSAFQPTYTFETYATGEVEGLSVGSVVKLRGVAVGKVTEIGFSWNMYEVANPACVVVRYKIKQKISPVTFRKDFATEFQKIVDQGLRAVIQTEGITGSSVVALQNMDPVTYPPLKVPWTPKYYYIPAAPSQLGRLLASVDKTLSNLEKLDVGKISQAVTATLESADVALRRLSQLDVGRISDNVNQVADDASGAIQEVRGLAEDARRALAAMNLPEVGQEADRTLQNIDERLGIFLEKLDSIDVNALNETLAGTREAARNLNDALVELKRHPSGFLFGAAPAPAKGLEKEKK